MGSARTTTSWVPTTRSYTIRNREREGFERLLAEKDAALEKLAAEKDRLILVLTDQVDYLRDELSQRRVGPANTAPPLVIDPSGLAIPSMGGGNPLDDGSEPEDELRALHRDGLLSEEELESHLSRLVSQNA